MSGQSFERYFRSIQGSRDTRPSGRLWCPAADVYRTGNGWIVKVDLAGIEPGDVQVTLDDRVLRLSGSRRDGICGEGISHYQLEITYSRFERILKIPCDLSRTEIRSECRDGWFILHVDCNTSVKSSRSVKTRPTII